MSLGSLPLFLHFEERIEKLHLFHNFCSEEICITPMCIHSEAAATGPHLLAKRQWKVGIFIHPLAVSATLPFISPPQTTNQFLRLCQLSISHQNS